MRVKEKGFAVRNWKLGGVEMSPIITHNLLILLTSRLAQVGGLEYWLLETSGRSITTPRSRIFRSDFVSVWDGRPKGCYMDIRSPKSVDT